MQSFVLASVDCMDDPADRTDRFELIATCDGAVLSGLADDVLASDPSLAVLQEPKPQLLMQQVREPVERRPFNLGEVVVTPAEVELDGTRGFAMLPGKAERAALSGAIVDAAVAADHPEREAVTEELRAAAERREAERTREWSESRHTAVEFETMEDEL
jgi:alpha-D-ribose 1-methylphosphonate 5-triphosphate synthase subunit PhnG